MGINVLSEFDGISCGQLALQRAGIQVDNYFASEIDKYAIKVTQARFPKTVQLGSVENHKSWNLPKIDLLIGGSPCQGLSNAGLGLGLNDPRSALFFDFVESLEFLREKNPNILFLLENVKRMKKADRDIITNKMGVEPININSALVSAQNRERLYWTNIEGITQPEDRHIYLKDVIEYGEVDRDKSYTIDANYYKGGNPRAYFEDGKRQLVFEHQSHKRAMVRGAAIRNQVTSHGVEEQLNIRKDEKSNCVVPSYPHKLNGLYTNDEYRKLTVTECERLQTLPDGYTEGISNTQRYKCIGNGWTVDVIAHILSFAPKSFFEV